MGSYYAPLQLTIRPMTALYTNAPTGISMNVDTSQGRDALIFDFNPDDPLYSRDLGTVFSWPIGSMTILDVWQPSYIVQPEATYNRTGAWMDGGNPLNKFVQGVIVTSSFASGKSLSLQSGDDMSVHTLWESPANFGPQQTMSFSNEPFIAHNARIVSTDGQPWSEYGAQLVFQPWPELCIEWQTELVALDLSGWGHLREMNLTYASSAPVTVNLRFDACPMQTYVFPATSAASVAPSVVPNKAKTKQTLGANKFKLTSFQAISAEPFYLFRDDLEFKIKQWGSSNPYTVIKPYGGASSAGAIV